jgi:hypothetical protein
VVAERQTPPLSVVAPYKCMLLYFTTVGFYAFYWCWRHWSLLRRREGPELWPLPRAVLHLVFMHSLFRRIDARLQSAQRGSEQHGSEQYGFGQHGFSPQESLQPMVRWSPVLQAWVYVLFSVAGLVLDHLAADDIGFPLTDVLTFMTLLPTGYALLQAQNAANAACGDPAGAGNARLSPANYLWLILGFLLWAVVLLGFWIMLSGEVE